MGNVTFKNFSINKLNKTLKQLNRNGVLVGPRATEGSYGDLANQLQASIDKADEKNNKRKSGNKMGKLKDQLAGIAALIAAIVAIGGGFVKYGEITTKFAEIEGR